MTRSLLELVMEEFDARLVSDGHEVSFPCPLCGDSKSRLFINLSTFKWMCHHCGEAGALISFLERVMEKDPFEAYSLATKIQPKPARIKARPLESTINVPLPGLLLIKSDSMIERGFWSYLYGRHIDDEQVYHYQMRYEVIGRYRGRVIIPIIQDRVVMSFAARAIVWWEKPKELYPQGARTSQLLFGIDDVHSDWVTLTEGILDTISLVGQGVAAVGTFGAHLSDEQRALLHRKGIKKVTVMRDADSAGQKDAAKIARELMSDGFEVVIAGLPEGEDPASANYEQLDKALDSAFKSRVGLPRHSIRKQLEE